MQIKDCRIISNPNTCDLSLIIDQKKTILNEDIADIACPQKLYYPYESSQAVIEQIDLRMPPALEDVSLILGVK